MSVTINDSLARIAISKNLIKEYKSSDSQRTVYLKNGTEFQIYLKNPYQSHLGVKIYVNNKYIGNMLVLRPGQSCWLERYLNENSKFLFSTYEVENSAEMKYAIKQNGIVKLEFYHEMENYDNGLRIVNDYNLIDLNSLSDNDHLRTYDVCYNSPSTSSLGMTYGNTATLTGTTFTASNNLSCSYSANSAAAGINALKKERSTKAIRQEIDATIETGRIEKGSRSDQEFNTCDIKFDYRSFKTEEILILPQSRKPVSVEETRRRYCSQCGKKVNPKDKFCSNCGARLN
jgi:hypothetical protein